jgi:hypothetical protein
VGGSWVFWGRFPEWNPEHAWSYAIHPLGSVPESWTNIVEYCDSVSITLTTLKITIAVTCDYPPTQLLQHPVIVVSGSQDSHPIEGQFITYTCPPGFILTGPNMSVCMGNREWEPDPGEVDCIGNNYIFDAAYTTLSISSQMQLIMTVDCLLRTETSS